MNIAVFASGNGSNFQAIASAVKAKSLRVCLKLLVCDNPQAFVLKRAQKAKVEPFLINRGGYQSKEDFEGAIISRLKKEKIDLIVLAGFMRILSPKFINEYKNKILNIHPSLLPAFKGAHAIADAFNYGVKVTGVTVHIVDEQMDHGPVILQEALKISEKDTLESIEKKIHAVEHRIYPATIRIFTQGKIKIEGRRVRV